MTTSIRPEDRMTMSGFCAHPSTGLFSSHEFCQAMQSSNTRKCTCPCHQKKEKK
jgi:hypothetical protein